MINWTQPYRGERVQDFEEVRLMDGVFRCDRCTGLWPLPHLRLQDGSHLCRRCWDPLSPMEAKKLMGEERAANAVPDEMLEYPPMDDTDGVHSVTGISPQSLNLTRGGSAGTINITGVNLSATDTWAASAVTPPSAGNIVVTPTVNSSTSVTLSISATVGVPRANYSLTFNGDTLTPRGILKIR